MAAAYVDQTVEELFRALRKLSDGSRERRAVEQWTCTHWLNSPSVINEAERVIEWWNSHPKRRAGLMGAGSR
jgi:hypothetical protein